MGRAGSTPPWSETVPNAPGTFTCHPSLLATWAAGDAMGLGVPPPGATRRLGDHCNGVERQEGGASGPLVPRCLGVHALHFAWRSHDGTSLAPAPASSVYLGLCLPVLCCLFLFGVALFMVCRGLCFFFPGLFVSLGGCPSVRQVVSLGASLSDSQTVLVLVSLRVSLFVTGLWCFGHMRSTFRQDVRTCVYVCHYYPFYRR